MIVYVTGQGYISDISSPLSFFSEILLNQALCLDPPKNPYPIEWKLKELSKWPNVCIIYIADCCRTPKSGLIPK
jgi:hypothetical protein